MDQLWDGLTRLSRAAIIAGCSLLFLAALIVTAEVIVRKAIPDLLDFVMWMVPGLKASGNALKVWVRDNMTFSGSDEISGYLFAVGTSWSFSHVLITRGHVRIDAVYGGLSPKVRGWLDLIALLCLALFVGALVERAFNVAWVSLTEFNRSNTNLRIHLAWSQVPWMLGIVLFFVTIVVAILKTIGLLFKGDYVGVNAVAGASSQDEEIEGELKGLGIQTPHGGKA